MSESRILSTAIETSRDWLLKRTLTDTQTLLQIAHLTLPVAALGIAKTYNYFMHGDSKRSESELHNMQRERESAASLHAEAVKLFQAGQYPAAITMIDRAIKDLYRSKKDGVKGINQFWRNEPEDGFIELNGGRLIFAEIHRFKGILLFYQGKYIEALQELQISTDIIPENPLALNVQAFIYLHKKVDKCRAKIFLEKSLQADNTQIFARFYLALLNENLDEVNDLIRQLEQIAERRKKAEKKEIEAGSEIEMRNFSLTSLDIFMPYLLADWLDFYSDQCNDPEILSNIAATCYQLVTEMTSSQSRQAYSRCLASKIKVLMKISAIKSEGCDVSDQDKEWLDSFSKATDENEHFFLIEDTNMLDRNLLRYFPRGFDSAFLKSPLWKEDVAQHIVRLALASRLADDQHPDMVALRNLCKDYRKSSNKAELELKLVEKASNPNLIEHFVDFYVTDRGPEPWLACTATGGNPALLFLLCRSLNIALQTYTLKDMILTHDKEASLTHEEHTSATIAVVLTPKRIIFAHNVTENMSKFYRLLAMEDCLKLLKHDPENELARKILASRDAVITHEWPHPQPVTTLPAPLPTLFHSRGFLDERNEKQQRKKKAILDHELARVELLAILKKLHRPQLPFLYRADLQCLQRISQCTSTVFAEFASALRIKLSLQSGMPAPMTEEMRLEAIYKLRKFQSFEATLLAILILAELELRGNQMAGFVNIRAANPVLEPLLLYLKKAGIIAPDANTVSVAEFKRFIPQVRHSTLLSYMLGYAAALLAVTCNDFASFNAYLQFSIDLGYQEKAGNLWLLQNQILGCVVSHSEKTESLVPQEEFNKLYRLIAFNLNQLHFHCKVEPKPDFCLQLAVETARQGQPPYSLLRDWEAKLYLYIANKDLHQVYLVLVILGRDKVNFTPNWQELDLRKFSPSEKFTLLNDLHRLAHPDDLRYRSLAEFEDLMRPAARPR